MAETEDFISWVSDPARTDDELYTVELVLESIRDRSGWPYPEADRSFEAMMEKRRQRKLTPKYRPALLRAELVALAQVAESVTYFSSYGDSDRLVRDVSALRFFPALKILNLGGSDVADFTTLRALRHIARLSIGEYGEFSGNHPLCFEQFGELRELVHLHLALRHPWPDLRALANASALAEVSFSGNILAFEQVTELPAARIVSFQHWVGQTLPLRDLHQLPAMPQVQQLTVNSSMSLVGIERYPSLLNLHIEGRFHDLTPLAAMEKLTALTLVGEGFRDLSPLARVPCLRELHLVRERPIDLAVLADCPQLRRVSMERCAMMRTELAALNAGLLPEALDFHAETPRPLPPLKFFRIAKDDKVAADYFHRRETEIFEQREKFFGADAAFARAEKRAMSEVLQGRFDAMLGKGWGLLRADFAFIHLKRYADTIRIREIVQVLREESARSRLPWVFRLIVEPHGDMSEELEQMKAREAQETAEGDYLAKYYEPEAVLRENEEQRRVREERYELLRREHQMQLRDEANIDPALLHLPSEELEEEEEEPIEDEPLTPADDDHDGEGNVALAPPPPAPPETDNLGEELMFYLGLYEDCMVAMHHWADAAAYNLGEKPVVWSPQEAGLSSP